MQKQNKLIHTETKEGRTHKNERRRCKESKRDESNGARSTTTSAPALPGAILIASGSNRVFFF